MSEESMTPDLVGAVTRSFEAADRQDWDAALRPYAPDAILENELGIFDTASRIRAFWEEWTGTFAAWTLKLGAVVDLGGGVVFAVYCAEGRPAGSSGVVTERASFTFEWADGLIAHVMVRQDIDEACAAAERLAEERG